MQEQPIYLKSLHPYNFRHSKEEAKVIGFIMFTPEGYPSRPCFKVLYESDNFIDHIPHSSLVDGHYEVITKSERVCG